MKKLLIGTLLTLALLCSMSKPASVYAIDPTQPVKQSDFQEIDPLHIGGGEDLTSGNQASEFEDQFKTPGGVLSRVLQFAIPLAGLILFVMIVWGGFEMLSGAANAKSKDAGRQRVTAALVGFLLLFSSYWIAQLMQAVFGIKFLN
jgi:hypothetical protein